MPYALGIDLGSGRIAAAISRNDRERWLEPEVVALDGDPAGVVSVLHLTDRGAIEVGSSAVRALPARAGWVARGIADRVGDEIPVTLGGQPYPAEVLTAAVVGWVVDYVEAAESTPASQLVVTHPASWGMHRRALLLGALREVNLPEPTLLPRPVAVAESHTAAQRVEVGEHIAVLSLGAARCESAVLRRGSFGFELRTHADGGDDAGGDLFDDLLAEHVLGQLKSPPEGGSLATLRAACASAKERLSTESAVSVAGVRVTRAEFEELIRPAVESTVESLRRTIRSAGPEPVPTVVIAGGSGRVPLVTELVAAGTRARVVAEEPETSIARGAALAATRVAKPTVRSAAVTMAPEPIPRSAVTHTDLLRLDDLPEEDLTDLGPPPPRPPVEIAPLDPPKRRLLGRRGRASEDDTERDRRGSRKNGEFADLDLDPRRRKRRKEDAEALPDPDSGSWEPIEIPDDEPGKSLRRRRATRSIDPADDDPIADLTPEPRRRPTKPADPFTTDDPIHARAPDPRRHRPSEEPDLPADGLFTHVDPTPRQHRPDRSFLSTTDPYSSEEPPDSPEATPLRRRPDRSFPSATDPYPPEEPAVDLAPHHQPHTPETTPPRRRPDRPFPSTNDPYPPEEPPDDLDPMSRHGSAGRSRRHPSEPIAGAERHRSTEPTADAFPEPPRHPRSDPLADTALQPHDPPTDFGQDPAHRHRPSAPTRRHSRHAPPPQPESADAAPPPSHHRRSADDHPPRHHRADSQPEPVAPRHPTSDHEPHSETDANPRHAAPESRRHRYRDPEDTFEPADRDGGRRR